MSSRGPGNSNGARNLGFTTQQADTNCCVRQPLLHRQRVEIADARAALSRERIAASKAATDAAALAVAATTGGYDTGGFDVRTASLQGMAAATAAKRAYLAPGLWASASVPHSISSATAAAVAAAAAARRCNSTMGGVSSKASKKLRRLVSKLQHDQGAGSKGKVVSDLWGTPTDLIQAADGAAVACSSRSRCRPPTCCTDVLNSMVFFAVPNSRFRIGLPLG